MPVVTNGRIIYVSHQTGLPEPGVHTKYVEEQLDTDTVPLNGGVLIKTLAISSDPYLRYRMRDPSIPFFAPPFVLGQPLDNSVVGVIARSEDPNFALGDLVVAFSTFETYSVYPGPPEMQHYLKSITKISKIPGIPLTAFLGTFGLAGRTAYQGWKLYGEEKAKTSKTLFVSTAAGPVGTFVIQLARATAPHLKIIGSAGSEEKLAIAKAAGADVVFNYKTSDISKILAEHGPIDIYWDNVSGPTTDAAIENMSMFGVIISCGSISGTLDKKAGVVMNFGLIFTRCITVHGFLLGYGEPAQNVLQQFDLDVIALFKDGKITASKEHTYEGLKNAEQAIVDVLLGKNVGKGVIAVSEE